MLDNGYGTYDSYAEGWGLIAVCVWDPDTLMYDTRRWTFSQKWIDILKKGQDSC
jgi:hypothetical protein